MTIEVTAHYFAAFRERAGRDSERVSTEARTAADLYGELARRHGFADSVTRCKGAVHDELAECGGIAGRSGRRVDL